MTMGATVETSLIEAIRRSSIFNPEVQVAPACILWPDRDRQWEAIIPTLQNCMPELLVLGEYAPEKKTGPAIWLRCVIARTIDEVELPENQTPIIYLPGVSRQDLRAISACPEHLKPLAELQYRGVVWTQLNAKDWTILAFLKSDQGGLGLDVAQDNETKSAMQLALYRLFEEEVELLRGKRLDRDFFNTLLTGGDPVRDLLNWLDQGDAYRDARDENEWKAFVSVCKSQMGFDPQNDGVLAGVSKLAAREGAWKAVWERYCEAPLRYPHIPGRIRQCEVPIPDMFADESVYDGWPQWNEGQEQQLEKELLSLQKVPPHKARETICKLDKDHGRRRGLVWAELGEAPLANALRYLVVLAETTKSGLTAGTVSDLAVAYQGSGWKADDAVVRALACVEESKGFAAVKVAVRTIYLPWAEESARYLQQIVDSASYPGGTAADATPVQREDGLCILFVDGLRFDVAKRLLELLERRGFVIEELPVWSALPSVTGTGKPAVAPIGGSDRVKEDPEGFNFELMNHYQLQKAIEDSGWEIVGKDNTGDGHGSAWCEFGNVDHEGHDRGWKLAKHLDVLLKEIAERIQSLFAAGWQRVKVVTDHGWLLLPGGLPDTKLAIALADSKWGRCASLKPGASADERLFPWYWNPHQHFALADGISCYRKGLEYTHGGLSLQECLLLELNVTKGKVSDSMVSVDVSDLVWRGMRCTVAAVGDVRGLSLDIRTQAGNPGTSVVMGVKPLGDDGRASVVIEDDDLEGETASVVLFDESGALVAQVATVIGGGE